MIIWGIQYIDVDFVWPFKWENDAKYYWEWKSNLSSRDEQF